jgi:hypothetical protein
MINGAERVPGAPFGVRAAGVVLAGIAAISLNSGCELNAGGDPAAAAASSPLAELPYGPCVPGALSGQPEAVYNAAEKCASSMKLADVALVDFSMPLAEAASIAASMETAVTRATKGKVTVSITAVPASAEAKQKLAEQTAGKNCIDDTNPEAFAAAAADLTMPELQGSDIVVAMSDLPSCTPVGGVADRVYGRRADIFRASAGGSPDDQKRIISSGAHELLHLYRLGHGGVLYRMKDGEPVQLAAAGFTHGKTFDFDTYVRSSSYSEYGNSVMDGDVMGSPMDPAKIKPNPVELAILDAPRETVEGPEHSPAKELPYNDWVTLNKKDAAAGDFATAEITNPFQLIDIQTAMATMNRGQQVVPKKFGTINIAPLDGKTHGFSIILSDKQNNTVNVGHVAYSGKPGTSTLLIGGQRLEVAMDGHAIKVRVR